MGKIDTSEWKEFRIGDYFKVEYGRFHAKDELGTGTVNYITTSGFNNGITNTCEEATHQGNCITVASDGAMGASFYQEEAFTTSNIVSTLTPLPHTPLNKYNALFLCAIIFGKRAEFGWLGFKMSVDRVRNLRVKLPTTPDGDPDWAYMESYMANLETQVVESLTLLQTAKDAEKKKMDTREWREFRVGELFDIHPTKAYKCTNAELLDNGETHVVVNSAYNNGVGGLSTLRPTEQGNMITFSDTVDANTIFYQDKPFIGYPHVQGLYPIGIFCKNWTELSLKYFATVFRQKALSIGFDYGNKFRRDIAVKLYIFLPVDKTGQPDWAYMEEYMRKVEKKANDVLNFLDRISTRRKIDDV